MWKYHLTLFSTRTIKFTLALPNKAVFYTSKLKKSKIQTVLWTVVSKTNIKCNSFEFCSIVFKFVYCKTGRSSIKYNYLSIPWGCPSCPCSPQTPKAKFCPAERCLTTVLPIFSSICVFLFLFLQTTPELYSNRKQMQCYSEIQKYQHILDLCPYQVCIYTLQ